LDRFAIVGLIHSALGIYGVSCAVAQRSRDHGIRLALGARPAQLMSAVLRQGIVVTVSGLGLGVAGALALTRPIESRLFGVKPHDPYTYVTVALLLLAVAMTAAYLSARRAARVDPMSSLRAE
jgi:putative ABC transport system permease protein